MLKNYNPAYTLSCPKIVFPTELGECEVYMKIESDETEACIHIVNEKYDLGVCLFKPQYYNKPEYILNSIEKETLIKYFDYINPDTIINAMGWCNWASISSSWDFFNDRFSSYPENPLKGFKDKIDRPNYMILEEE